MVKHSPVPLTPFFTRERFGRPQVLAAFLLCAFLAQCLWLVGKGVRPGTVDPAEIYRLERGTALWRSRGAEPNHDPSVARPDLEQAAGLEDSPYDPHHSPLWYLIAAAPLWLRPVSFQPENIGDLHWSAALPYLIFGLLLGASLWYVARRLFGNAGGYIVLALYCFSPGIIRASAVWSAEPEVGAAWGAFGAVFTAIAVAHTLYAPREVVLWNWRRIVLLALSMALAVGSQFSLIVVVPVALAFMLYLAPTRRAAALAIWAVACSIALLLWYASYFFHARAFWQGIRHASFFGISWEGLHHAAGIPPGSGTTGTKQSGAGAGSAMCAGRVLRLASRALLWEHGATVGRGSLPATRIRHTPLSRPWISVHGRPLRICVCRRGGSGSARNSPSPGRPGRHPGPAGGQRGLESLGTGSRRVGDSGHKPIPQLLTASSN